MSPLKNRFGNMISDPGCASNVPATFQPPASAGSRPLRSSHGLPLPNGSSYTAPPDRRHGRELLFSTHIVGTRSYSSTVRVFFELVKASATFAVNPPAKRRVPLICRERAFASPSGWSPNTSPAPVAYCENGRSSRLRGIVGPVKKPLVAIQL